MVGLLEKEMLITAVETQSHAIFTVELCNWESSDGQRDLNTKALIHIDKKLELVSCYEGI